MNMRGKLTREQAVACVGEPAVRAVEAVGCQPTNRVGYNGSCQADALCEWCASVSCKDALGEACVLEAYYYTTNQQDQIMAENDGDGSAINWEIHGYEVV